MENKNVSKDKEESEFKPVDLSIYISNIDMLMAIDTECTRAYGNFYGMTVFAWTLTDIGFAPKDDGERYIKSTKPCRRIASFVKFDGRSFHRHGRWRRSTRRFAKCSAGRRHCYSSTGPTTTPSTSAARR